jgi:hypothetical protein
LPGQAPSLCAIYGDTKSLKNIIYETKKGGLAMVHTEFQEAIKRLSTDEEYRKSLVSESERIEVGYGMDKNGMLGIQSIDPIGIDKEELRPVAACCTCLAAE